MKELHSTAVGGMSKFTVQQQAFRNNLVLMRALFLYLKSKLRKGIKNSDSRYIQWPGKDRWRIKKDRSGGVLKRSFGPSFHPKARSAIPKFVLTVFFYSFLENVQ